MANIHPPGVKPPLAQIFSQRGEIPEPIVRWSWKQRGFQVSYDNGYNWYDRAAAANAVKMFKIRNGAARTARRLRYT